MGTASLENLRSSEAKHMPDCIWSILAALLIFSKPGLWKVFKKLRNEESPHLNVLTCCAAQVPKPSAWPTAIFHFRVPKHLHLQTSLRCDRIVAVYQIKMQDLASCVRLG